MNFTETKLKGVYIIEPERFEDERGFFMPSFSQHEFEAHGLAGRFVETNILQPPARDSARVALSGHAVWPGETRALHARCHLRRGSARNSCARQLVSRLRIMTAPPATVTLPELVSEMLENDLKAAIWSPGTLNGSGQECARLFRFSNADLHRLVQTNRRCE